MFTDSDLTLLRNTISGLDFLVDTGTDSLNFPFLLVAVSLPIIGADFLCAHHLLVTSFFSIILSSLFFPQLPLFLLLCSLVMSLSAVFWPPIHPFSLLIFVSRVDSFVFFFSFAKYETVRNFELFRETVKTFVS